MNYLSQVEDFFADLAPRPRGKHDKNIGETKLRTNRDGAHLQLLMEVPVVLSPASRYDRRRNLKFSRDISQVLHDGISARNFSLYYFGDSRIT